MNSDAPRSVALAVVKYFPYGGMQRTFLRIAKELLSRGHQVEAVVRTWEGDLPDGLKVTKLSADSNTNHGLNRAFGRALKEWRMDAQPDVLVGFNKLPGLDLYYAGDPCFAEFNHRRPFGGMHRLTPRYRGMRELEAAVFEWGKDTEILLFAHGEKSKFQKHYDTEDERFHLLPPGIDRERLDRQLAEDSGTREQFLKELGLDPNDPMIVMIGSGFRTKGVDRVIRSVAAMPHELAGFPSLVIVGDGKKAPLRKLAKKVGLGARCVLAGTDDRIASFLKHAHLLAHPARLENTGTALIEAMYCATPVVATANCGFAHHIIQAEAGIIVPEPFDQAMFDGLLMTALLAPNRVAWGNNGQSYTKSHDLYSLVEKACDVIEGYRSKA